VKPIYSEEDRHKIVVNFISLRGQGRIPIIDFSPLTRYLSDNRIKLLHNLQPTGRQSYIDRNYEAKFVVYYTATDAEEYFNWLISIITGAEKAPDDTATVHVPFHFKRQNEH
jgi:hypothetical protein